MAFEIGEKLEVDTKHQEKFIGTLVNITLGVNEKEHPTEASIVLKDNVLEEETYGLAHVFCCDIKDIKRFDM